MNGATWVRVSGVLIPTSGLLPLRPERKKLQVRGLRTRYCPWSRVLLCTTLAYWQLTGTHVLVSVNRRCVCSHSFCLCVVTAGAAVVTPKVMTGVFLDMQIEMLLSRVVICKAEGARGCTEFGRPTVPLFTPTLTLFTVRYVGLN